MENIVLILETSIINTWIMSSLWAWPIMEILHFIGLSILLGSLLVIDLRLMGIFRKIHIEMIHSFLPLVFIGFFINFITGILFVIGDPARYTANIGFWVKMCLVILALMNAIWFKLKISPKLSSWPPYGDTTYLSKFVGCFSLVTWFGVLLLGRLIPYIGTG